MVPTAYKRSWLRTIYAGTSGTLLSRLTAALTTSVSASSSGQVTSTSANGRSVTFATPNANSGFLTQQDTSELAGEMVDRYERAVADLETAGISPATDAQIFQQMLSELAAMFSSTPDFSTFRMNGS